MHFAIFKRLGVLPMLTLSPGSPLRLNYVHTYCICIVLTFEADRLACIINERLCIENSSTIIIVSWLQVLIGVQHSQSVFYIIFVVIKSQLWFRGGSKECPTRFERTPLFQDYYYLLLKLFRWEECLLNFHNKAWLSRNSLIKAQCHVVSKLSDCLLTVHIFIFW